MKNSKLRMNVELALFAVLIVGVWSLLSLPVIFYHLPISEVSYMLMLLEKTSIIFLKWVLAISKVYYLHCS